MSGRGRGRGRGGPRRCGVLDSGFEKRKKDSDIVVLRELSQSGAQQDQEIMKVWRIGALSQHIPSFRSCFARCSGADLLRDIGEDLGLREIANEGEPPLSDEE